MVVKALLFVMMINLAFYNKLQPPTDNCVFALLNSSNMKQPLLRDTGNSPTAPLSNNVCHFRHAIQT